MKVLCSYVFIDIESSQSHIVPRNHVLRKLVTTNACEDVEKENLMYCYWECTLVQPPQKRKFHGTASIGDVFA
ncbi:hypothetical protein STEG23_011009 [Scotinomys teguina]